MKRGLFVVLALSAIWPFSSLAAPSQLPTKPGAAWKHTASGLDLPATLAGLKRTSVKYFSAADVDVAGEYQSADGNDIITIYLFRDVAGNVPVWFDRARFFIMNLPEKYGEVRAHGIRPFTPRGQTVASGLAESYAVGNGWRTSALMILPIDGFYAKIRLSSKTRDTASLETLMTAAANAFDWSRKSAAIAAVPVVDCPSPLPPSSPAKPIPMSSDARMAAALVGGALAGGLVDEEGNKIVEPVPLFCKEPASESLSYAVYRPDAQTDEYLLAVHDAGRGITVGRNALSQMIHGELDAKDGQPSALSRYTVSFVELDKTQIFGDFESLPLPEQAVEQVEKAEPLAVVGTWGEGKNQITIVTD